MDQNQPNNQGNAAQVQENPNGAADVFALAQPRAGVAIAIVNGNNANVPDDDNDRRPFAVAAAPPHRGK